MPAVTFPDLDPQDTDSALILKQKKILAIIGATTAIAGSSAISVLDSDSFTSLEIKELQAIRELQAALEA